MTFPSSEHLLQAVEVILDAGAPPGAPEALTPSARENLRALFERLEVEWPDSEGDEEAPEPFGGLPHRLRGQDPLRVVAPPTQPGASAWQDLDADGGRRGTLEDAVVRFLKWFWRRLRGMMRLGLVSKERVRSILRQELEALGDDEPAPQ